MTLPLIQNRSGLQTKNRNSDTNGLRFSRFYGIMNEKAVMEWVKYLDLGAA